MQPRTVAVLRDSVPLLPSEIRVQLGPSALLRKIHFAESTDSTNDLAIARARGGGEEGEIFLAEQQLHGRGREGRRWESPPFKNLALSILLRPRLGPEQALPITLVAAQTVHQVLSPLLPTPPTIKWPNDVIVGERKIAGILTQSQSELGNLRWVVCGIGVNLNSLADDFSLELRKQVTSVLIETGEVIDRTAFTVSLLRTFESAYRDFLDHGPGSAR